MTPAKANNPTPAPATSKGNVVRWAGLVDFWVGTNSPSDSVRGWSAEVKGLSSAALKSGGSAISAELSRASLDAKLYLLSAESLTWSATGALLLAKSAAGVVGSSIKAWLA